MKYSLSLVVSSKKVHCAVIPRGHVQSYPLTLDQELKPFHTQLMMVDIDGKTFIYGVTGPNPNDDLTTDIVAKWSARIGKTVTHKAFLSWPEEYRITRPEIQMWLSEYANLEDMRPSELARLLRPFPEERTANADA